jgi:hypothetical protein
MMKIPHNPSHVAEAAWKALQKNRWEDALEIAAAMDFQITDLNHFRLLCSIYLQAERWKDLAEISELATRFFPDEPIFWEIHGWAEYIQGHVPAALEILNNVAGRFPHRESLAFMLAYINSAAANLPAAKSWFAIAARLSEDKHVFRLRAFAQPELKRYLATEELYFPN